MKYLSRGPGYSVYLTATEVRIVSLGLPASVLRMKLVGSNRSAKIEPLDPLPGRSNYFIGSDPSKWRPNVPNFAKVAVHGVYPGIDLIFYGNQQQLEYDVVVTPGADPNRFRLKFAGADRLRRESNGDVIVNAGGAEIRQRKPVVYQVVDGQRRELEGGYVVHDHNEVAFEVARYDAAKPLVIDPVLVYSTYLGGDVYDYGGGIAVDFLGNAYITGTTASSNFPLAGAYPSSGPSLSDVFVTKLSPKGTLVYSLILSGRLGYDSGYGIAVDPGGNAYVTGNTQGGFPIVNALQPTPGSTPNPMGPNPSTGNSAFVTKINPQGSALIYSTYLGGSGNTVGRGIAVDASGNAVVAGFAGVGFPVFNALQSTFAGGTYDAFVTKINAEGSGFVYSTYLGGSGTDGASGVAVDSGGNAYITGTTTGAFPVVSAFQNSYGGGASDAFVAKLNPQGTALVYSTYLGGSGDDQGSGIAVDASGNVYVTGYTSGSFPLAAALQSNYGGGPADVFVSEMNAQGAALVYSTYLGGSGSDSGAGIAVDLTGNAYVTGRTSGPTRFGSGFPVKNAVQPQGGNAAFVAEISAHGATLVYSTYLGGGGSDSGDSGAAIAVDDLGTAYVTGSTNSTTFPTANALQSRLGTAQGFGNAFVSVLSATPGSELFGSFDTPLNNTNNVIGAIPVTGWALSPFSITKVEIYRDSVGNERLGLVFIGNATFVPGARPDVQARYPNYVFANFAGWGYQLLTNVLPNNGNGTFQLHAIAYDSGGNVVELGAPGKTISCTNANAAKPFGTIDSPGQGDTVSGSQYLNFGWTLTPGASFKIPTDGSTITVMVDGAPLGHPTYNQYRSDIATMFPNYTNSQGAVGFFYLDSTKLANGMHAISWVVYDDHNRGEGIGSRYFMAENLSGNVPAEEDPIESAPDPGKVFSVEADELDRIELHVGANGSAGPLPIGATLKGGVFYWQLGPGFLGEHKLVLKRPDGEELQVRVLVHPKTYSEASQ